MACGMSACGSLASVVQGSPQRTVDGLWRFGFLWICGSLDVWPGPRAAAAPSAAESIPLNEIAELQLPSPIAEAVNAAAREQEERLAKARATILAPAESPGKPLVPVEYAELAKALMAPASGRTSKVLGLALVLSGPLPDVPVLTETSPKPTARIRLPLGSHADSLPPKSENSKQPSVAAALLLSQVRHLLEESQFSNAHALVVQHFKELAGLFPDQTAETLYRAEVGLGRLAEAAQTLKVNRGALAAPELSRVVTVAHLDFIRQIGDLRTNETTPDLAQTLAEVMDGFARSYPLSEVGEAAFAQLRRAGTPQAELIRRLWPSSEARRGHALDIFRRLGNKGSYRAFALALGDLSSTITKQASSQPDELSLSQKAKLLGDAEWFMSVREYELARSILEELAPSLRFGPGFSHDKLLFLRARCANATNKPEAAAALYAELFSLYPGSPYAWQAKFNHLQSLHHAKRHDVLPGEIRRLSASDSKLSRATAWLSLWSFYLALLRQPARPLGAQPLAEALSKVVAGPQSDRTEVLRARYWLARLHERRGDRQQALAGYRELVAAQEQSLYRILARWRLTRLENGLDTSPLVAAVGPFASVNLPSSFGLKALPLRIPSAPTEKAPGPSALPSPDSSWAVGECRAASPEVSALVQLGMLDFSQVLLRRVRWSKLGPGEALGCAKLAFAAGDFKLASTLSHRTFSRRDRVTAGSYPEQLVDLGPAATLWFPRAYGDIVEAASKALSLDPALVFAIMKAESHFRPFVTSRVGARGLMQIMPETGARIAQIIGFRGFHPDTLFEPAVNIALGSWYLRFLLDYYRGDLIRAIAAYNAGPSAIDRWANQSPDLEIDEFAENIPFSQTHAYVRKVMGYMDTYLLLRHSVSGSAVAPPKGLVIDFGPGLISPLAGVEIF